MKLSVVATLYRSSNTVDEFYRRALAAALAIASDVEIVLVNDGSPDDSLDKAVALHHADPRVVVVDLARNFGHHKAMMTGLAHARGDLVFLIDSDLEEEPELLRRFYEALGDNDVVYGVQQERKGGPLERLGGALYFRLIDALSEQRIPRNLVTVRLMTRQYVKALVRHKDREFVISHLWALAGHRQAALVVRKLSRRSTTYSLQKRIDLTIKHVTTTSTKLLSYIFYVGVIISILSVATILAYLFRFLFFGNNVDGWTSLIISVWFFGGLLTMIMGIMGIYIANIMSETKRRPYTTVRRLHRAVDAATITSNCLNREDVA